MEFSPIFDTIFNYTWFLIPIFIFAMIIRTPWFKGVLGEFQVNLLIKVFLNKDEYHLIKDVTLLTDIAGKDNGTTQIDHIIVSRYGVFLIETKNMKGWIFGSEHQKQWTQQIFKHKSKFQNPLHQNYKHVKTLEPLLPREHNANTDVIFSVIIFIGDSTFKTKMPNNVRFARGGIEYIKSKTDIVFNAKEVTNIIEVIERGRLARGSKTNREHINHVKKTIEEKSDIKICIKCGGDMVLRKSTKGKNLGNEFWGCSTFPKCRNISKL